AVTVVFILAAGVIMPLITNFDHHTSALTVGMSRVLFPVILLLGLNGLLMGILQSHDRFTLQAISPAVWNAVTIVLLVLLRMRFHGENRIYALAIGILAATGVQFAMAVAAVRRIRFNLSFSLDWRDPRLRQVFTLMLPIM